MAFDAGCKHPHRSHECGDSHKTDTCSGEPPYQQYCFADEYSGLMPWRDANTACPTCREPLPVDSIQTLYIETVLDFERRDYPYTYHARHCYHAKEVSEDGMFECGYVPCARDDLVYVVSDTPTVGKQSHSCPAGYLFGYNAMNKRVGWVPIDVLKAKVHTALV